MEFNKQVCLINSTEALAFVQDDWPREQEQTGEWDHVYEHHSPIPVIKDTVHINCVLECEFTHMEKHYLNKILISLYVCEQGDAIFIMLTLHDAMRHMVPFF